MRTRAQSKKEPEASSTSKRRNKKDGYHSRHSHRACRKSRREFLICPEGGDTGNVQLTQLNDNAGPSGGCHHCHDGGIKCILGHHVPKESIDAIRYLKHHRYSGIQSKSIVLKLFLNPPLGPCRRRPPPPCRQSHRSAPSVARGGSARSSRTRYKSFWSSEVY